jgi:hypothetical protein
MHYEAQGKVSDEFKIPRARCSRYCFGVHTGFEDGEMKQRKGAIVVVILFRIASASKLRVLHVHLIRAAG